MARATKELKELHRKYDDKEVCFTCTWMEMDEQNRSYCTCTEAEDFTEFVPCAYRCTHYCGRKWRYKAI